MSQYKENTKRAVALKYDTNKNKAPVVIASGSGFIADKVVEIAEESGIPVYRDDSLSVLLSQLDIGSEIPEELFSSIVDIYVYFLNFKLPKDEVKYE
jgi:flagellar biosynthesis protein